MTCPGVLHKVNGDGVVVVVMEACLRNNKVVTMVHLPRTWVMEGAMIAVDGVVIAVEDVVTDVEHLTEHLTENLRLGSWVMMIILQVLKSLGGSCVPVRPYLLKIAML